MYRFMLFCTTLLAFVAALGFAPNADATITALCVGCTASSQFESAAWQAFSGYTQGINILVVNPNTGLSKWVFLVYLPAGVGKNSVPASVSANANLAPTKMVQSGVATPDGSNSYTAIYIASNHMQQPLTTGPATHDAVVSDVSSADQAAIDTAIKLTGKTWLVELNTGSFPSYLASDPLEIAMANYTALTQANVGWPVSEESDTWFEDLLKVLGLYTGHSLEVCDVFHNGDSVCADPDPFDNTLYRQVGPAKDANGNPLPAIGSLASGGAGVINVYQNPPYIDYTFGGGGSARCAYVNGNLQYCLTL